MEHIKKKLVYYADNIRNSKNHKLTNSISHYTNIYSIYKMFNINNKDKNIDINNKDKNINDTP